MVAPSPVTANPVATRPVAAEWHPHPVLAFTLRAGVMLTPVAAALLATSVATRVISPPVELGSRLLWWLAMAAFASAVAIGVDRLARRLLPLATLLKLTLVFPDRAPSRMSIALRTGTTRQLADRVEKVRARGGDTTEVLGATELLGLVAALSSHDRLTRGHSERVRALADLLASQIGLDADQRNKVRWAALLHDVGKLTVPAEILNKRGRPTPEEWTVIESHPAAGARLISGPLAEWLGEWADGVGDHHEKWDGSGYPRRLAGEEISLAGRLVAVVDAYEVMTSLRSYKKPLPAHQARGELARCAGTHFDPDLVRAFLQISIGRLRVVMGPMTWLAQIPLLVRGPVVATAPAPVVATGGVTVATGMAAVAAVTFGVIPVAITRDQHERLGFGVTAAAPLVWSARTPARFRTLVAPSPGGHVGTVRAHPVGTVALEAGSAGGESPSDPTGGVVVDDTVGAGVDGDAAILDAPTTTISAATSVIAVAGPTPVADIAKSALPPLPGSATTSSTIPRTSPSTTLVVVIKVPAPASGTPASSATDAPVPPLSPSAATPAADSSTDSETDAADPAVAAAAEGPATTTATPVAPAAVPPTEPGKSATAPGKDATGPGNSENAPGRTTVPATVPVAVPATGAAPAAAVPDTTAPPATAPAALPADELKDLARRAKEAAKTADKLEKEAAKAADQAAKAAERAGNEPGGGEGQAAAAAASASADAARAAAEAARAEADRLAVLLAASGG